MYYLLNPAYGLSFLFNLYKNLSAISWNYIRDNNLPFISTGKKVRHNKINGKLMINNMLVYDLANTL